ncbi:MAG: class II glutamine amidotransferase, partial [Staphylococcus sp.]|nr:class II glutamine amidotransferase [Staphylococcus sp.]
MFNYSGLNEECGVFGIWNHSEAAQLTYMGLHSLQHRGQEGAGIVVSDGEILKGERGLGLLTEAIKGDQMDQLKDGHNAIGHVRYATSGNKGIENIQPFLYHFYDMSVAICHNGNLINAQTLRQYLEKHGAIFHSSSDTEVIMHLIRRSKAPTFEEALKESLRQIKGGFTFAILTKDALYGAVDPNAIRPLVVGKMQDDTYILASETCAIDVLGAEYVQDIHAGEYVVINHNGIEVKSPVIIPTPKNNATNNNKGNNAQALLFLCTSILFTCFPIKNTS